MLEDLLAEAILQGAIAPGDTILVDAAHYTLTMRPLALATSGVIAKTEDASTGVV